MAEKTCAEKLAEAREALHNLMTGVREVSIGYADRRVQYSHANISELRQYIYELEQECGDSSASTTRRRPLGVIY